jgi:hypothetical protein
MTPDSPTPTPDPDPDPDATQTPEQTLTVLRIIWASLVMGIVTITGVLVALTLQNPPASTGLGWAFAGAAAALMALAAVLGHVLRQQMFKAGWQGDAVRPSAYASGTIAYLAAIEGACVLAAIFLVLGVPIVAGLAVVGVGLALMALNFPTGKPMRPADPRDRIGNFDA